MKNYIFYYSMKHTLSGSSVKLYKLNNNQLVIDFMDKIQFK
jgi:hypothetical protein